MKLHQPLVDFVEFNGRRYRIDARFQNVMRCLEIIDNQALWPDVRTEKALRCFVRGRLPKDQAGLLEAILRIVVGDGKPGGKRTLSYEQDADMIYAAFLQAYGIDLMRDNVHWWQFRALLANLPSCTRMAEVVDIRMRPVPPPTKYNKAEREALIQAKTAVSLRGETPSRESADAMVSILLALAQKG